MTKIILVRHGETVWNKDRRIHGGSMDIPLSEKGLIQAECLAKRLDSEKLKAIYSSHQKRALETAEVIARHKKLKINIETDKYRFEMFKRVTHFKCWFTLFLPGKKRL